MTRGAFKQKNLWIAFSIIATVALLIFSLQTASAQNQPQRTGNGLRITPVVSDDHTVQPGNSETVEITVTNITEDPIPSILPQVDDFDADEDEGGSPRILEEDEESELGIRAYVDSFNEFSLAAGERRVIPVTFNFPLNATPGTHTGVIRFTTNPEAAEQGLSLNASVGTLVFITVEGDLEEDLSIASFDAATADKLSLEQASYDIATAEAKTFFQEGPSGFLTRVQNNGNVFSQPFGTINVKDMFGNTVESLEFNAVPNQEGAEDDAVRTERGRVLPDSIRKFFTEADTSKYNIGRYTAEITVAYGEDGEFKTTVTNFWVIPWQLALAVVGGLTLLILILTKGRRWYNERVLNRAKRR